MRKPWGLLLVLVLVPSAANADARDDDFAARCAADGVLRCIGFDSTAEVTGRTDYVTDPAPFGLLDDGDVAPGIDAASASGAGSLMFTIPSNSGSSFGSYWTNFSDDLSVQFGVGDDFYVQWRQRFSPELLETTYYEDVANQIVQGGWKQVIVGEGDRPGTNIYSCTDLEIVPGNGFQRGFPQIYHSCGAKDGHYEGLEEPLPPYDFLLQNAIRDPACTYSAPDSPPCVGYVADQWMTFQLHVHIGTPYTNNGVYRHDSIVQLWVAREGEPSTLVIDFSPHDPGCQATQDSLPACQTGYDLFNDDPAVRKYGQIWLLPYMTRKDPAQPHPVAYTWYDELIVSSLPIADPNGEPPGPPPGDDVPGDDLPPGDDMPGAAGCGCRGSAADPSGALAVLLAALLIARRRRARTRKTTPTAILAALLAACGGGSGNGGPDGGSEPDATTATTITLTALPVSSSKIRLTWNDLAAEVGAFRVLGCDGASCDPDTELVSGDVTEYVHDGLGASTTHCYAVAADDPGGAEITRSATACATTRPPPGTSPLAMLADSMDANSWAELPTDNIDPTLVQTGADGNALGYTDDITFDPASETFYYFGSDHNDISIFASFDAVTNTWARLPRAAWMPAPSDYNNGMMHAYDHSAIDVANRAFYHRPFGTFDVHRYDLDAGTWDAPPVAQRPTSSPFGDYANCCDAMEAFPELGGVVWVSGDGIGGDNNAHVYLYSTANDQWSVLAGDVDLAGTWQSAEYNPVAKVLIFYSASTDRYYKLDAARQVTPIANPPFTMYDGSSYVAVISVDPVGGKYVALSAGDRQLYTYDVATDTWAPHASTNMPDLGAKPIVATPVSTYGVIFYAACRVDYLCKVYLYKPG